MRRTRSRQDEGNDGAGDISNGDSDWQLLMRGLKLMTDDALLREFRLTFDEEMLGDLGIFQTRELYDIIKPHVKEPPSDTSITGAVKSRRQWLMEVRGGMPQSGSSTTSSGYAANTGQSQSEGMGARSIIAAYNNDIMKYGGCETENFFAWRAAFINSCNTFNVTDNNLTIKVLQFCLKKQALEFYLRYFSDPSAAQEFTVH
jgi:hypothetical protein